MVRFELGATFIQGQKKVSKPESACISEIWDVKSMW